MDLATLQKQASRGNAGPASRVHAAPAAPEALPASRLQGRSPLPGRRELEGLGRPRTAAERVLAAELQARGDDADALSMMVSSIARMVQAGKTRDSRWKAS